jgi:ribosomal protein S2
MCRNLSDKWKLFIGGEQKMSEEKPVDFKSIRNELNRIVEKGLQQQLLIRRYASSDYNYNGGVNAMANAVQALVVVDQHIRAIEKEEAQSVRLPRRVEKPAA